MAMCLDDPDASAPGLPLGIAILARAPVVGAAKTRLIPRLGPDGAAALHARLVLHTLRQVQEACPTSATLWCSPDVHHGFFEECRARFDIDLAAQGGGDLGARMHAAFASRNAPLLLIGTDCPTLGPDLLREAAAALADGRDAVFCPAEDGGYALVGLRAPCAGLFRDMAWGVDGVMSETRARLSTLGLSWHETAPVWDVDRPEDVDRLAAFPQLMAQA